MLGLFGSIKKYLIIGGIAAALGTAAWVYVSWTHKEFAKLHAELGSTRAVIATQAAALESLRVQMNRQVILNQQFNDKVSDIRDESAELRKRLGGLDLGQIAQDSPKELEEQINAETQKLFDDFEAISRNR